MPAIKKILVFGNPLVRKDSLPPLLIEDLKKLFPQIKFKEFDAIEDLQKEGRKLYLLDAVDGINRVQIITDIDWLVTDKIYSLHDFDLAYTLKLLKKTNKIDKVSIIGVPTNINKEEALEQLKQVITSILSSKSD